MLLAIIISIAILLYFIGSIEWDSKLRRHNGYVERVKELAEKGEYEEAINISNRIINLKDDYVFHYLKGWIFLLADQIQEAIEQFNKAIEINPDYLEAYHMMGNAYYC